MRTIAGVPVVETQCPNVAKFHASVSGFHSTSSFGDEDSIDKNNANTIKNAAIAPANIVETHLLQL